MAATVINLLADLLYEVQRKNGGVLNFSSNAKNIYSGIQKAAREYGSHNSMYSHVLNKLNINSVVDLRHYMAENQNLVKEDSHVGFKLNIIVPEYKTKKPLVQKEKYVFTPEDEAIIEDYSVDWKKALREFDLTLEEDDIHNNQ